MAGIEVHCSCGNSWHVSALAQEQHSRCHECGQIVTVPPHERRRSREYDPVTRETVIRDRVIPIGVPWGKIIGTVVLLAGGIWVCSVVAPYLIFIVVAALVILFLFGISQKE